MSSGRRHKICTRMPRNCRAGTVGSPGSARGPVTEAACVAWCGLSLSPSRSAARQRHDTETAAVYVGFVAGIIRSYPQKADELIEKMLPIEAEDHWFIVRAIAYSGMPGWRDVLSRSASRMPTRQLMIEKYTSGKLPTLEAISFEKSRTTLDRLKGYSARRYRLRSRLKARSATRSRSFTPGSALKARGARS
jgi:hypothetical protein